MLDITGIVDLISTGIQGGIGFLTKAFSGKGKANGVQKALYDNTIEIGRDISPAFGEVLNEFFYGKGMNRDTVRSKITKALADINLKESDVAEKLSKLEDYLDKIKDSSYTVTKSAGQAIGQASKEKKALEEKKKKMDYAGSVARGTFDDATTQLYENKNIQNIAENVEQTIKDYNERTEDEKI